MSGAINPNEQGGVIPVIYGEVITGGVPISGGLSASQVGNNGNIDQSCSIGGEFNPQYRDIDGDATVDIVMYYSATAFNLTEPYSYVWTVSGFSGATVSISQQGTATVKLTLHAEGIGLNYSARWTGTLSLSLTGKAVDANGDLKPKTVTDSQSITVDYHNTQRPGGS